jgi:tRNA threonylcarbamoyladenosine modification (KEOPS) complex  Pcc1 subunit
MNISCDITLDYEDETQAKIVKKSLSVDDDTFVKSEIKGKQLKARIESKSISSFLHTLDDYLACVTVAENIIKKKQDIK